MAEMGNSHGNVSKSLADLLPAYLPRSDSKGNYWLGKDCTGPAILSSCIRPGTWFASMGNHGNILCRGKFILYFSTPERALEAMRTWVTNDAS